MKKTITNYSIWYMYNASFRFRKEGFITLFLLLCNASVWSQQAISSSGGDIIGNNGSVSYTIGQVSFVPLSGDNKTVLQGVQQPPELPTGIRESKINVSANIFPNPSKDYTILTIERDDLTNLTYQIYSIDGRLIAENAITNPKTTINTSTLSKSLYFIKITYKQETIKSFKLIKIN